MFKINIWLGFQDLPKPIAMTGSVVAAHYNKENKSFNVFWTSTRENVRDCTQIWHICGWETEGEAEACHDRLAAALNNGSESHVTKVLDRETGRAPVINHMEAFTRLPVGKRQLKPFSPEEMLDIFNDIKKAVGDGCSPR